MKLSKFPVTLGCLVIATSLTSSACGISTSGSRVASTLESTESIEVKVSDLSIKAYPASRDVTYVDIEVPLINHGTKEVSGEVNVWIYPANEPDHLVSFLRTRFELNADQSKVIKPTPSLVRPPSVKNGDPRLYKLRFEVNVEGKRVESFEQEIEIKF